MKTTRKYPHQSLRLIEPIIGWHCGYVLWCSLSLVFSCFIDHFVLSFRYNRTRDKRTNHHTGICLYLVTVDPDECGDFCVVSFRFFFLIRQSMLSLCSIIFPHQKADCIGNKRLVPVFRLCLVHFAHGLLSLSPHALKEPHCCSCLLQILRSADGWYDRVGLRTVVRFCLLTN